MSSTFTKLRRLPHLVAFQILSICCCVYDPWKFLVLKLSFTFIDHIPLELLSCERSVWNVYYLHQSLAVPTSRCLSDSFSLLLRLCSPNLLHLRYSHLLLYTTFLWRFLTSSSFVWNVFYLHQTSTVPTSRSVSDAFDLLLHLWFLEILCLWYCRLLS